METDPGINRKTLSKRAKCQMTNDDSIKRRAHTESLPAQGHLMRTDTFAPDIWAAAACKLGSEGLKFVLNAATDTLPHNCNLAKWRNGAVSEACRLCGNRQTLLHVLNGCERALHLRRYNQRHDSVLSVIAELAQDHLPENHQLTTDLGDSYEFPTNIIATTLRPDMVIWSERRKSIQLVELTVCYESGFKEAAERKEAKYQEIMEEARRKHYKSNIITIQVGSGGVLDETGLKNLQRILQPVPTRRWRNFLTELTIVTMQHSHIIWCSRNQVSS